MSKPAVLGKGLHVHGRVRGDGDLRVEAQIEGDVVVSGNLELDEGASIAGGVEADAVVVAGVLTGDVSARGAVAITASGKVEGDIKAAELSLAEGGSFVGSVNADFDLPEAIA